MWLFPRDMLASIWIVLCPAGLVATQLQANQPAGQSEIQIERKKKMLRVLIISLLLGALSFLGLPTVHAEEMTCAIHTPVMIDIKPGAATNPINLSSNGLIPVAVPTTRDFDASQFTPEMAHFSDANIDMTTDCAGAMAERWTLDDVNGDAQVDLVFFFRTQDLNLGTGSTAASLMAHGTYGSTTLHILGTDSVKIVPKND
jgi:hypothetical protein